MNNLKNTELLYLKKGSGIHIKKKNRGKFTEYCGGKVTDECINKAKKSKNPILRKRATFAENARAWKHEQGGVVKYQEGTTKDGITTSSFNPPKIVLTDEQKALAETGPEQRGKVMQAAYLQNMRDYAKAWYSERYKNPKYRDQLAGNMDKINALLDIEGYTPYEQVSVKLGGKKPVAAGGLDVDGGYVEASKSIDGKPFWFGKTRDTWWHEGIGHWVSESVPGLLSKNPGTYMKYLGGNNTDLTYQNYINKLKERHSDTWAFRGLNKDLRDAKGNLYIDPNRQLTPEDVDEMKKNPRFRLPSQWQNTNIDSEGIANMHNTFASNDLNKKQGQYDILLSKKGNKLIKK